MLVKNISPFDVFVASIGKVGTKWKVGQIRELDDVLRTDKFLDDKIQEGKLQVLSYSSDAASLVVQEELDAAVIGGGGGTARQEILAVTAGQPAALSFTPLSDNEVELTVNGLATEQGTDYLISGSNITWISPEYTLDSSDIVIAFYRSL